MTRDELAEVLQDRCRRGAFFATLETSTVVPMRKTGNPHRDSTLRKYSRVNVALNVVYGNSVNRQRDREGSTPDFEPEARTWGERIPHSCFVEHKGNLYLECKVERVLGVPSYTLDGTPIDVESVRQWMPVKSESSRQGVDREIVLRDYALSSIQAITFDGVRHVITDAVPYVWGGVG